MKKTLILFVLALIVLACGRKAIVISNPRTNPENTEAKTNTETHSNNADMVSQGRTVYINRCGRCHALRPVEKYTTAEWENILKAMIPKARLNETERAQVNAFVMAYAKKN